MRQTRPPCRCSVLSGMPPIRMTKRWRPLPKAWQLAVRPLLGLRWRHSDIAFAEAGEAVQRFFGRGGAPGVPKRNKSGP